MLTLGGEKRKIPYSGKPDNIYTWKDQIIISSHNQDLLNIILFDPEKGDFSIIHKEYYPFGETGFGTQNSSFYLSGQYGDAIFSITKFKEDKFGRLLITDFISGKLFILE